MVQVNLFFCNPVSYGGHVTFTVHLMRGLRKLGIDVALFKPRAKSEHFTRSFGYGEVYRNICMEDVKKLKGKKIITAPSKPLAGLIDELLSLRSMRIVIHDPAEFKHGWSHKLAARNPPIVIRKTMIDYFNECDFLPHPYDRHYGSEIYTSEGRRETGISTSRIDFDKHTEFLLDANRLLPKKRQISIRGFENRIYTRFNIMPKYPEWTQSIAKYERGIWTAVEMCREYMYMLDMSIIKGDGGGTQYTFLEAMDAGTIVVVHGDWQVDRSDEMKPGTNCLVASSGKEIAALIKTGLGSPRALDDIRKSAVRILNKHRADKCAAIFMEILK